MIRKGVRLFCSALLCVTLGASSACDLGWGSDARPDVHGTWDLTYDDYLELELEIAGDLQQQRVPLSGGAIRTRHAGTELQVQVSCARDEVLCPNEIWARHLTLDNRVGQVDGDRFSIWLHGEGAGPCQLGPGSLVEAELETIGEPGGRYEATMLTAGKIVTELNAACLRSLGASQLPADARVRVRAGFSGVRRTPAPSVNAAAPTAQDKAAAAASPSRS